MARLPRVEPLVWPDFKGWFSENWQPGEHVSVIAPTGAGKTTLVGGLLDLRRYVLALDPKGGDSTLAGLGYERLTTWPGEKKLAADVADNDEAGKPSRFIVGPRVQHRNDLPKLRETTRQALEGAFNMGGWTTYGDELQIMTDPRMMNLRGQVDEILIAARDKGLSFVSSYQAPSWVTPHAAKMSTWVAVSYTRDTDVVNRLAEVLGRPREEIRGALKGLDPFSWLIVGRNPREPYRVTLPDYLAPAKVDGEHG
jgi:hypothetical protein